MYLAASSNWDRKIVIEGGPKIGFFYQTGAEMQEALSARGFDATLVNREDTLEIIADVNDPENPVNVGFIVQQTDAREYPNVESLGSISYSPLLIFARKDSVPKNPTIRDLAGLKVQIGPPGSSLNSVAFDVLDKFGLAEGAVTLEEDLREVAIEKVLSGESDAATLIFPLTNPTVKQFGSDPNVVLVEIPETEALVESLGYSQAFEVEQGMFDLERGEPKVAVQTIAMPVTVVADKGLPRGNVYAIAEFLQGNFAAASGGEFPSFIDSQLPVNRFAQELYESGRPWQFEFFPSQFAEILLESLFFLGVLLLLMSLWKFFFPDLYKTWDSIIAPSRQANVVDKIERRLAQGKPISRRMQNELNRLIDGLDESKVYEKKLREIQASLDARPRDE